MLKTRLRIVGLIMGLIIVSYLFFPNVNKVASKSNAELLAQFFNIPIYFESNQGQTDSSVKYLTRGSGYTFYFTPQEIVTVFSNKSNNTEDQVGTVLKLKFLGANLDPVLIGTDVLPSKSNYFIGKDSQQWKTNISHFEKVCYKNLYDGIDAVFYGNAQQLEYDLIVAPGMNPKDIRFRIEGADELALDSQGNLQLFTDNNQKVLMQKPLIYQLAGEQKLSIDGHYTLLAKNEVGFTLGAYDITKQLVIDPIIYSTYLNGTNFSEGLGITADSNGNAYITGVTSSSDFPTTFGAFQTTLKGETNVIITKLNPLGTGLIYSTYLGGAAADIGYSIAVDSSGNAFITGVTSSSDFPTTSGAFQTIYGGENNAFVTKLNSTGSALVYSTFLGGTGGDQGNGIAIDGGGNAYITGFTSSSDFPTTSGAFQTSLNGAVNVFITKLNSTGTAPLVYSTYLGGSDDDEGAGIAIDGSGNAYITGLATSSNFPTTPGAFQTVYGGTQEAFITKLNPGGTALVYSTFLGGTGGDQGYGIAVDGSDNAYIAGVTGSFDFPTTFGAFQTVFGGGRSDAFITKLNSVGTGLIYSTYLGGTSGDSGKGIVIDSSGNAYIAGATQSSNFPTTSGAFQRVLVGVQNAFITKLNSAGSALLYSTYLGGSDIDLGNGVAIDSSNNIYVTGSTNSPDFPTTAGAFQTTFTGSDSAFIAKFQIPVPVPPTVIVQPPLNLRVKQVKTKFVSQTELLNLLKWSPPDSGSTPVSYQIYRDSLKNLIAQVPANGPLFYKDHNRKKNRAYTYYIISVDASGQKSTPASITFQPEK